jgi:hypothetical protein
MADYLETYPAQMELPVAAGVKVDGLCPAGGTGQSYRSPRFLTATPEARHNRAIGTPQ